ncbi:TPA: hypothetical protein DDZ86_05305 [Candidatus Dependentiae bacterium]|nr:hypothetical protein [Candidatus Dependentiae bacterium]
MWNEELVPEVDSLNHHGKRIQAILLALIFYCLFVSMLFVDMRTSLFLTLPDTEKIRPPRAAHKSQPAPVRWLQPPPPSAANRSGATQPKPLQPPSQTPTPPQPSTQAAQPPISQPLPTPQPAPKLPTPSTKKPTLTIPPRPDQSAPSVLHPTEQKNPAPSKNKTELDNKTGEPTEKRESATSSKPETSEPEPRPARRRRSFGESWLKNPAASPSTNSSGRYLEGPTGNSENNSEQTNYSEELQERAQNWDRSFRGYLNRRYGKQTDGENPSGTETGHSAGERASQVGHELFMNKLVYAVCDSSNSRPLQLSLQAIPMHIIVLWATITKNRTISEVRFEEKSPYPFINRYIDELMRATPMPQLPTDWHEESLTIPLRVRIQVHPEMKEIRLIPASW